MTIRFYSQSKIYLDIGTFLVVFVSISYILSSCYIQSCPDLNTKANEIQLAQEIKSIRTLIVGDSHVKRALDTSIIPASYNYSTNAEDYYYSYQKLKKLIKDPDCKIKTTIIQLDVHCLVRKLQIQHYLNLILGKALADKLFAYASNLTAWQISLYKASRQEALDRGFGALPGHRPQTHALLEERIRHHYKQSDLNPSMKIYLERIIQLLSKQNIQVIIISYPISRAYYQNIPTQTLGDFLDYQNYLRIQYQAVIFLDYQKLMFTSFEDTCKYFYDFDHLNADGATILSNKLVEDLTLRQVI